MEALQRLYSSFTKDLAPGIQNPGKVVRDRILYRSAKESPPRSGKMKSKPGGNMDIDSPGSPMPLEKPQASKGEAPPKQTPAVTDRFSAPDFDKEEMASDPGGRFTKLKSIDESGDKVSAAKSQMKTNDQEKEKTKDDDMPMIVDSLKDDNDEEGEGKKKKQDDDMSVEQTTIMSDEPEEPEDKESSADDTMDLMGLVL